MLVVDGGNNSVIIGHNDGTNGTFLSQAAFQVVGTDAAGAHIGLSRSSDNAFPCTLSFAKSRGAVGTDTAVQDDDEIGQILFAAGDGTDLSSQGANIKVALDGTPGANDVPCRMTFGTTADGASSATERLRIHSNGVASFNNGIALGVGTANTASNVLDDYEEGTWTPQIQDDSGNNATVNSGSTGGTYTKIGRMVALTGRCTSSSVSGLSGIIFIKNLPFAAASGQSGYATLAVSESFNLNITGGHVVVASIAPGASKAALRVWDNGAGNTAMTPAEWSDDGYVMFSGVYVT
jgi:hypothetical protein